MPLPFILFIHGFKCQNIKSPVPLRGQICVLIAKRMETTYMPIDNELWHVHLTEYYEAMKKNEVAPCVHRYNCLWGLTEGDDKL